MNFLVNNMVGINTNKPHNTHRLICVAYKKDKNVPNTDIVKSGKKLGMFYGGIISAITSESDAIGGNMRREQTTFYIETYDQVEELKEGDFIFVENMEKLFIIDLKETDVIARRNGIIKFGFMNKRTTFKVRGLL